MVQALSPIFAIPISAPASTNEPILSVTENSSTIDIDSNFVDPIQDSVPDDESCPGLAEIQIRAVDFFSAHPMVSSIFPTDVLTIADYADPNESPEDDPDVENPDPSFDRDNPLRIPTKLLPLNSISPSQHPFAPFNPDEIRGQFDTGAPHQT